MSDSLFPTLKGLTYPISKTPTWNTVKNKTVTGLPTFIQCYTYPWYNFKLQFSYLEDTNDRADDIQSLMGFYNNVGGAGQDFLFADMKFENNSVTNQTFGSGDGTSTEFRLARSYGAFAEPVFGILINPVITSTLYDVTTTMRVDVDFTWSTQALITFTSPPAKHSILKWTGDWYYRCHFKEDTSEFVQMFYNGWSLDELNLESMKLF